MIVSVENKTSNSTLSYEYTNWIPPFSLIYKRARHLVTLMHTHLVFNFFGNLSKTRSRHFLCESISTMEMKRGERLLLLLQTFHEKFFFLLACMFVSVKISSLFMFRIKTLIIVTEIKYCFELFPLVSHSHSHLSSLIRLEIVRVSWDTVFEMCIRFRRLNSSNVQEVEKVFKVTSAGRQSTRRLL